MVLNLTKTPIIALCLYSANKKGAGEREIEREKKGGGGGGGGRIG